MGQDQGKPKDGASASSAQYDKEAARMHHVTTKETVVATKTTYDAEADRLQEHLASLTYQPPLLVSSVEGSILGKRDKFIEEIASHPTPLREHMLFNEDLVRLFAQYQTIEMREGAAAAKRAEEIAARMSQTVFYSNVLRSSAAAAAQRLRNATESLSGIDALADAVQSMHDEVVEVSQLSMEINGMLSEADRMEVKNEVERLMNEDLVRSRSNSQSSVMSSGK